MRAEGGASAAGSAAGSSGGGTGDPAKTPPDGGAGGGGIDEKISTAMAQAVERMQPKIVGAILSRVTSEIGAKVKEAIDASRAGGSDAGDDAAGAGAVDDKKNQPGRGEETEVAKLRHEVNSLKKSLDDREKAIRERDERDRKARIEGTVATAVRSSGLLPEYHDVLQSHLLRTLQIKAEDSDVLVIEKQGGVEEAVSIVDWVKKFATSKAADPYRRASSAGGVPHGAGDRGSGGANGADVNRQSKIDSDRYLRDPEYAAKVDEVFLTSQTVRSGTA